MFHGHTRCKAVLSTSADNLIDAKNQRNFRALRSIYTIGLDFLYNPSDFKRLRELYGYAPVQTPVGWPALNKKEKD